MTHCRSRLLALALSSVLWVSLSPAAQDNATSTWTDKDTRLATEYLGLLVEKPDDDRVLELLWTLYDKRQQADFLLESIAAQAAQQPHPNVLLIHAQLLRRAGRLDEALTRFQEVLKAQPDHPAALRGSQELLQQKGDPGAALENLQKLTATVPAHDPRHAKLLLQQAGLLLDLNRPDEAAQACEKALAERPTDSALLREASRLLLGAGMLDKTVTLMERLVQAATEPTQRLDALFDLARLHEQGGHFKEAAVALQQGLDMLHDKDWRYAQFFQRLVKLHERFDQLDELKKQLLAETAKKPVTEKALNNLARYSSLVVDGEERIKWLRELVAKFPDTHAHRWELVSALLDHDHAEEAAQLLDPFLKRDGHDRPQLLMLRALAYLHQGRSEEAVSLLQQLLDQQTTDAEIEKQVLAFARQKSLDALVESILQRRIARQPGKPEPLFELATFQRTRGNHETVEQLFNDYIASAPAADRQRRLNEVASFLSTSPNLQAAEKAARDALASPEAGREELLRLADVLTQRSATMEAQSLLERAWTLSTNDEQRADVDERLASVLTGDPTAKLLSTPVEPSPEFKLPAMFTGEGFGSDSPVEKEPSVPETLASYAQNRAMAVLRSQHAPFIHAAVLQAPPPLRGWLAALAPETTAVDELLTQRAAWWCLRTGQADTARLLLHQLVHDGQGNRRPASLEMEKLWLEVLLLQPDQQPALAIDQLHRMAELDPASRTACLLRLAELEARRDTRNGVAKAISILEDLLKSEPANETVLSALAQFYLENSQRDKALALWENAARNATGKTSPLLERYGELLVAQRRFDDYLQTQVRLLEQETDIKRRRDFFQRALQRLLWTDAVQGELSEDEVARRLDIFENLLVERARRDPFEGFWNEALAHIYEREGDDEKAFAAMKQAYYTAPDTPFSLEQLRVSALRVGDIKSAIYFQKQIAASSAAADQPAEWRQLVQLLESDFRMDEADRARRRLEARFSQDPAALEQLARYYTETAQDEAAQRVLEQLVRVRGWDATNLLRLALQQKTLGDKAAATDTLIRLLGAIPAPTAEAAQADMPPERWPWPVFDEKEAAASSPAMLLGSLENAPGLDPLERDRLRHFLSLPRPELTPLPDDPAPARLRAIQELVSLNPAIRLPDNLNEIEQVWAHYHSGKREALRQQLVHHLLTRNSLEARFLFAWLGLKSHNLPMLSDWVWKGSGNERNLRKKLVHTCLHVLSDDLYFSLTEEDAVNLGSSGMLSHQETIEFAQKLESRHDSSIALVLAEAMRKDAPALQAEQLLHLARIAENSGNESLQRRYYEEIWNKPLLPVEADASDGFIRSFGRLWQLNRSAAEREYLLRESWRRLQQLPPSTYHDLRKARLLAMVGVTDLGESQLKILVSRDLVTTRAFVEPMMGKLPPGVNPGPRIDSFTHMQDYWRDLRVWSDVFREDGLSPLLPQIDAVVQQRNAGVALGPRATYEFNAWRHHMLMRQLRFASFPERLRLVREILQTDDSVDTMLDLGNFLESQGFAREAIAVYQRLAPRAPANDEYSQQLRRACDTARECATAIDYIEKLLAADVHFKPQGIDETLREEHARHLARLQDPARLRQLAYSLDPATKPLPGRVPDPVPYLKELALMLEVRHDDPGALAAWEEMHRLWPRDIEASLHRAQLLQKQGNDSRALEALREIPLVNFWNDPVREAFALRAELAAKAGLWDELRDLMNLVTGNAAGRMIITTSQPPVDPFGPPGNPNINTPGSGRSGHTTYTGGVLILSRVLVAHQRLAEAESLLQRAERSVHDNSERFKLRMEQLRLAAARPGWSPAREHPRIAAWLRAFTDDREALNEMVSFLDSETRKPRAAGWLEALRQPAAPQHSATALALSVFASRLTDHEATGLVGAWQKEDAYRENARELTVQALLDRQKPQWAKEVALSGPNGGLGQSPQYIAVLQALGDRHGMEELFASLVRSTFPGSANVAPYADAFAKAGRHDLAEELYSLALQRLRDTASIYPPLIENYARFLIGTHRYEQAETLLLHEHQGMTDGLAALFVELYREWNKLDQLEIQLAKYHLPDGIYHEVLFLASQSPAAP